MYRALTEHSAGRGEHSQEWLCYVVALAASGTALARYGDFHSVFFPGGRPFGFGF
jgi:hypothetical protein